jgi:hypothetical protein
MYKKYVDLSDIEKKKKVFYWQFYQAWKSQPPLPFYKMVDAYESCNLS